MGGTVVVKGVELGAGTPAVIVPVTGADGPAVLAQARAVAAAGPDLVEWRADLVVGLAEDPARLVALGRALAGELGGLPVLVTLRSVGEGGAADLDAAAYLTAVGALLDAGLVDLLDVEVLADPAVAAPALGLAHAAGVPVVGSHHDWSATPAEPDLLALLERLAASGADVLKVAVTPRSPQDVLSLLSATDAGSRTLGRPVIGIAMGELGVVSRLVGGVFGSAATFATVGEGSAPGQLDLAAVRAVLALLGGPAGGVRG